MYRKGADFERELVRYFRASGTEAVRVAGSKGPVDVVAYAPGIRCHVAIQCKVRREDTLYLQYEEVKRLLKFAESFRATPLVAWKPAHRRTGFPKNTILVRPDKHLQRTDGGNYKITLERALKHGMSLDDLTKKRLL